MDEKELTRIVSESKELLKDVSHSNCHLSGHQKDLLLPTIVRIKYEEEDNSGTEPSQDDRDLDEKLKSELKGELA